MPHCWKSHVAAQMDHKNNISVQSSKQRNTNDKMHYDLKGNVANVAANIQSTWVSISHRCKINSSNKGMAENVQDRYGKETDLYLEVFKPLCVLLYDGKMNDF